MTDAPKNKGGRPPFKPTKAQRSDVVLFWEQRASRATPRLGFGPRLK